MVLIVLALVFLGMLATFVVLASKAPQKAPRAVVVSPSSRDLFVPLNPTEAPREGFPRGTAVYDGR